MAWLLLEPAAAATNTTVVKSLYNFFTLYNKKQNSLKYWIDTVGFNV